MPVQSQHPCQRAGWGGPGRRRRCCRPRRARRRRPRASPPRTALPARSACPKGKRCRGRQSRASCPCGGSTGCVFPLCACIPHSYVNIGLFDYPRTIFAWGITVFGRFYGSQLTVISAQSHVHMCSNLGSAPPTSARISSLYQWDIHSQLGCSAKC